MSDPGTTIVVGQAPQSHAGNCGCCSCLGAQAQRVVENRYGLPAIAYRVDTHAGFAAAMRARLSASDFATLPQLRSRDTSDYSIALIDAWAVVSDILTFYQERIANESYLRTATERLSVIEMARLIGYRARPGVAASTYLAFAMEDAAGAPEQAVVETEVETGVRVQSIPGPGEQAQTFETAQPLRARLEWSAMKALRRRRVNPATNDTVVPLLGVDTQLKLGDALLFVGLEQETDQNAEHWDIRFVRALMLDHDAGQTFVSLDRGLHSNVYHPAPAPGPRIFAMRLRAALFGYNAPNPDALKALPNAPDSATIAASGDWKFTFNLGVNTIELDGPYPQIAPESWIVLSSPANRELYKVKAAKLAAQVRYWITGKTTRIDIYTNENLTQFEGDNYRKTAVFAQNEELILGDAPVAEPVIRGDTIILDRLVTAPDAGRLLIVRGKRACLKIVSTAPLTFTLPDSTSRRLRSDERLVLLEAPLQAPWDATPATWRLRDEHNAEGTVLAAAAAFQFIPAAKDDETLVELAELKSADVDDGRYTRLRLTEPLRNIYDLAATDILGNVVLATNGETTSEILGGGDAAARFQSFTLKQTPLTYVSADNPAGAVSTLQVSVGGVTWHEVPALYGTGAKDRVYTTAMADDGKVTVMFGDGVTGAQPYSGQNNIRATYRKGIGPGGLVKAGQLSLLLSRPLGIKSVVNPLAASGAAAPDAIEAARDNAPIGVLTLDRTVSLRDYMDFARGFAGIAKALATWTWDGHDRRVLLTVAGDAGAAIGADSAIYGRLLGALRAAGDPFVAIDMVSFRPVYFRIGLKIKVEPDRAAADVLAAVEAALRRHFAFEARGLGQTVSQSEAITVAQSVDGVQAVDLDRLYRAVAPFDQPQVYPRLTAAPPQRVAGGQILGAELLTLDPAPLQSLQVMP